MKSNTWNPFKKFKNFICNEEKKFVLSDYNYGLGPFSSLFQKRKWWWRMLISILVGILMGVTVLFFVQNTGLYSSGLAGFFQGISRISYSSMLSSGIGLEKAKIYYNILFYGLYFVANIPLLFFAYYKIGKNFAILSFNVLLFQNVVPFLLQLIPGIDKVQIFGDPSSSVIKFNEGYEGIIILTFMEQDVSKFGSLLIYSIFTGLIMGVNYSLILVVSGSTGGLDFISFYYSIKRGKPISTIIIYFNLLSIIISSIIGTFIPISMLNHYWADPKVIEPYSYKLFFSQNLVISILTIIISGLLLNYLFPKNKIVKVGIYSENILKIRDELYKNNFNHALTIHKAIGGYSLQEKQSADIICLYIELPKLLHEIHRIDPNSLITISHIIGIKGKFKVEELIN